MRLGYDWISGPIFSHGGFGQNTIENEIKNYFPDKSDLEGEFMVLFFQYEENDTRADSIEAFQKFVDCLVGKYGLKDSEDNKDRFVFFEKDLRVKDVRGKIILVASVSGNDFYPSLLTHNKVPVAHIQYNEIYSDGHIHGCGASHRPGPCVSLNGCPKFFEQNKWDAHREENQEIIKIGLEGDDKFEGWFQFLERTKNVEGVFHKTQISPYNLSKLHPGKMICTDNLRGMIGCNHYAYDLLNNYKGLPFGFVRFDFIGSDGKCYGDKLLDLIVDNNMHNSYYGNGGRKVEEEFVAENDNYAETENEAYIEDYNKKTEVVEEVQPVIYNDGYMLYVENYEDNAVFNVYDMGRNVVAHSTTAPIEISHLKKGFYILEINGKGYKFVMK